MPQLVNNPVQELLHNPKDFLGDHLIIAAFNPTQPGYLTAGPHQFKLAFLDNIKRPGRVRGTARLHDGDCYYLQRETGASGPNTFMAYWIPYEDNSVHAVNLGNQATLAFTARMDACAFGYTNFANGIAVACHANAQNQQGTFDDQGARHMIGPTKHKLTRQMYKTTKYTPQLANAEVAATTIGIRSGNKWHFYFQKYEMYGLSYLFWGLESF